MTRITKSKTIHPELSKRIALIATAVALILLCAERQIVRAAGGDTPSTPAAQAIVMKMLSLEDQEAQHKGYYLYLSKERSERTSGHMWTEWVAETSAGKLRHLIAEDGQPLSPERAAAEKARLDGIAANPDAFRKQSQAGKDDETHARQMFGLLPKAFVLDNPRQEGDFVRINFKPNPSYDPQSMEERVLRGMEGTMLIDEKSMRLHELEGRLPEDINIGFGLLATIKAGSNFATTRDPVPGNEWKTAMMDTDINGRAMFFKSIGRKEHAEHSDFSRLAADITVPQAVELLEKK
jgi:hypothetical protein